MKFIYFPFTYVSPSSYKALAAFFRKITVFQADMATIPPAMKSLLTSGVLEAVLPVTGHEKTLREQIASFKEWGAAMDDKNRAAIKASPDEPPFFPETAISKIRVHLKESLVSGKEDAPAPPQKITEEERLLWAGLVLELAREWDMETEALENSLSHYKEMEKKLFESVRDKLSEELTGEDPFLRTDIPGRSTEGKIEERLLAWSLLLPHYQEETGVFITDNTEVIDHLREFSALGERLFRIGPLPEGPDNGERLKSFHAALETHLSQLTRKETDCGGGDLPLPQPIPELEYQKRRVCLDVYVKRQTAPSLFFNRGKLSGESLNKMAPPHGEPANTVVCLICGSD